MITLGPLAIAAPWGLLALAGVPAILAIHLFRRRSPPRTVTGLFLYPLPVPSAASGRRRERIVASTSLWLELLAALAIAWWLADVHALADQHGRHLAVLLDDRIRLQAQLPAGDSPAARLRAAVDQRLAGLRDADRVSLITSGAVPRLLAGPAATPEQARRALAAWQPTAAWHDLESGIALALQLTAQSGADEHDVLLASDRVPLDLPDGVACIAAGEPVAASGLADVRWLRDATGERLVVRIAASGAAPARQLQLSSGAHVLATVPAPLAGTVILAVAGDADELTLTLLGPDPLPADDMVVVRRPALRAVRVTVALPPKMQLLVDRVLHGLPEVTTAGAVSDLVISATEQAPPGAWQLRLAPAAGSDAVLGPFLIRRGHPIARDLDGTGLLWVGGLPSARLPADAESLISAGAQVLLAERRRGRDRLLTLHGDPTAGTLAQHPLWPALLANLIEARRAALPGVVDPNRPANQPTALVLPPGAAAVEVIAPSGGSSTFTADTDGLVLLPPLGQPGAWRLQIAGVDWQTLQVNALDERMGDLAAAETKQVDGDIPGQVAVERRRSPAERLVPLVLAALAAAGACWCWTRGR